jgi:hypothetical protein
MKAIKTILFLGLILFAAACNDDDDKINNGNVTLNFTHNWEGENVSSKSFNTTNLTNANGEVLSISKLRYLVSNISLVKPNGALIPLSDYLLIDVTNDNTSLEIINIPFDTYTNMTFTFGFNEVDNVDGDYLDLNSTSWNWPTMLGGGYHFMQFEGKYEDGGTLSPFAYHMGTARKSTDVFEQNFFNISLDGFSLTNNAEIEIKMNIAEWFKNPITWDLKVLNVNLMPNYDAQKIMNENGKSVFSLGEITQ